MVIFHSCVNLPEGNSPKKITTNRAIVHNAQILRSIIELTHEPSGQWISAQILPAQPDRNWEESKATGGSMWASLGVDLEPLGWAVIFILSPCAIKGDTV